MVDAHQFLRQSGKLVVQDAVQLYDNGAFTHERLEAREVEAYGGTPFIQAFFRPQMVLCTSHLDNSLDFVCFHRHTEPLRLPLRQQKKQRLLAKKQPRSASDPLLHAIEYSLVAARSPTLLMD